MPSCKEDSYSEVSLCTGPRASNSWGCEVMSYETLGQSLVSKRSAQSRAVRKGYKRKLVASGSKIHLLNKITVELNAIHTLPPIIRLEHTQSPQRQIPLVRLTLYKQLDVRDCVGEAAAQDLLWATGRRHCRRQQQPLRGNRKRTARNERQARVQWEDGIQDKDR